MQAKANIKIFSHWNEKTQSWQSNHEQQNFWPGNRYSVWTTKKFVGKLKIIFDQTASNYNLEIQNYQDSDHGYYLIFYGTCTQIQEHHGLAFVTKELVQKCNQGTAKLLIVFAHETFDTGTNSREWFGNFCGKLSQIGINRAHSVVVLTGTRFCHQLGHDNRCDFVYYPWFEADLQASFLFAGKQPAPIDFDAKTRHFINLNLVLKPHRFLMLMYLMYRNCAQQGFISWKNPELLTWRQILSASNHNYQGVPWIGQIDKLHQGHFFDHVRNTNVLDSMGLDDTDDVTMYPPGPQGGIRWCGADQYYQRALVDLISETHCELYGDVFVTEKTFKPMAYGLPYIFNASRNHLAHVKQLGYHSFPELFDESYDQMPACAEKIAAIGNQIHDFCTQPHKADLLKNSPDLLDKLQANQDLFWNKNHPQALGQLLNDAWMLGRAQ